MCNGCRQFAESMLRSAIVGGGQIGSKPATSVINKVNFKQARLPVAMKFTHATSRTPAETKASGGFDPAFSSEICYSSDVGPDHEQWFDRMTFAAVVDPGRKNKLSKVADFQGYGTDKLKEGGHQYVYEFTAPAGTLVRSTRGGFTGEVCFPEPIPYAWIYQIYQVVQIVPVTNPSLAFLDVTPPELKKHGVVALTASGDTFTLPGTAVSSGSSDSKYDTKHDAKF